MEAIKIKIDTKATRDKFQIFKRLISKEGVLSNFCLINFHKSIYAVFTNLEVAACVPFAEGELTESILLNFQCFYKFISKSDAKFMTVTINSEDGIKQIEVDDMGVVMTLPWGDAKDFPVFGISESFEQCAQRDMFLEGGASDFISVVDRVGYAVAVEDSRFVFNGIYFDKGLAVGTDGKRMVVLEQLPIAIGRDFILPIAATNLLVDFCKKNKSEFIYFQKIVDAQVQVFVGESRFVVNLIDGQYPNYKNIIPKELDQAFDFVLSKSDMLRIKKLREFTNPSRQVKFDFNLLMQGEQVCKIQTYGGNDEGSIVSVVLAGKYQVVADEISIGLSVDFFIEAVSAVDARAWRIEFNKNAHSPLKITTPEDMNYLAIVMPMQL